MNLNGMADGAQTDHTPGINSIFMFTRLFFKGNGCADQADTKGLFQRAQSVIPASAIIIKWNYGIMMTGASQNGWIFQITNFIIVPNIGAQMATNLRQAPAFLLVFVFYNEPSPPSESWQVSY